MSHSTDLDYAFASNTNFMRKFAGSIIRYLLHERKINVYIPTISSNEWMGGTVYYNNLLAAVRDYAPSVDILKNIVEKAPEQIPLEANILWKIARKMPNYFKRPATAFYGYSIRDKKMSAETLLPIDAIFSTNGLYIYGIPVVTWIPDFQHVRLPEMFSQDEISLRNTYYKEAAERSTLIVFSSKDALSDFTRFAPEYREKGRVMSFCTSISEDIYSRNPMHTVAKYQLPDKFFYLPNQFWKHKNHSIVINALDILSKKGVRPIVVCTGNTVDYRHPDYFPDLMCKIRNLGLSDQFVFLGLIPREDVFQLIRQSVCIINPSLFEGWSTTVEEVKSIGKAIVLSDIAVHREQNPIAAVYFNPNDALHLADALMQCWVNKRPGPSQELEAISRNALPSRLKTFAETFVSIIRESRDIYSLK